MSKKKKEKESMIYLNPKPIQTFFVYHIQSKERNLQKKELLEEKGEWRIK